MSTTSTADLPEFVAVIGTARTEWTNFAASSGIIGFIASEADLNGNAGS